MKYGAHIYLFAEQWSDERLHLLDVAKELDLDMLELSVGDDVHFTPSRTARRAAELGIDLFVGPGGLWPLECDLSADDPAHRARGLDWHRKAVDLAAEIGAVCYAGALYGHPGVVKRRRPPAGEVGWTAEGLHALGEYAAARNVVIALEPMSHFRTHVVNTPHQLLRLIEQADHTNLRVLLDTYHVVTEIRDYAEAIRTIGARLFALHACENDRGVPGGGLIPWEEIFIAFDAIRFEGYVGLEGYNSGIGDFAFSRGMFHNVCPDGEVFVRKGVEFLRGIERRTRAV